MCIAILNVSGIVPESHIENAFLNNYDGAGIAWIESGVIKTWKTMEDIDGFHRMYKSIREINSLPVMLHFRISTHGKTNINNVHPFPVGEQIVMMHNGIIDFPLLDKKLSDTHNFAKFISGMQNPENVFDTKSNLSKYVAELCGNHSKMVFLSNTGEYHIFGEDKGHWVDQNWYSNYTYQNYGLFDYGGYSSKNTYSEYSEWYGEIGGYSETDTDSLIDFAIQYDLNVDKIDDYGVDWSKDESKDIQNWVEISGYYYFKETYNELIQGA